MRNTTARKPRVATMDYKNIRYTKRYTSKERQSMRTRFNIKDSVYLIVSALIVFGLASASLRAISSIRPYAVNAVQAATEPFKRKVESTDTGTRPPEVVELKTIEYVEVPVINDERANKLEAFLLSKKSPLAPYAAYMVAKSDEHGIDYTIMAAIAGKESSYGKHLKPGSHNPFGLGGRNFMYFDSWEEAIDYEARLLGEHYRLNANRAIGSKYCPAHECSSTWAQDVTSFSKAILATEAN